MVPSQLLEKAKPTIAPSTTVECTTEPSTRVESITAPSTTSTTIPLLKMIT